MNDKARARWGLIVSRSVSAQPGRFRYYNLLTRTEFDLPESKRDVLCKNACKSEGNSSFVPEQLFGVDGGCEASDHGSCRVLETVDSSCIASRSGYVFSRNGRYQGGNGW
jgi:hypothetical protein